MSELTIKQPDDWHIHLRDGAALLHTVPDVARIFGRAVIMPNLQPPIVTTEMAESYRQRILAALPEGSSFQPLMTLYLTDNTEAEEIARAAANPTVIGAKLYPAGATTHSEAGVTSLQKIESTLAAMEEHDLVLQVHGEVTRPEVDVFDREKVFIDSILQALTEKYPALRIVFEHITTADAVAFVRSASSRVGATITAHHLLANRNHMLVGGIRPHLYCLPVLKTELDRQALLEAACSGDPSFFAGTDSAPHAVGAKESACGCAGIYTAPHALELYAEAFESADALERLEDFCSVHGAHFYGLPLHEGTVTLTKENTPIPQRVAFGEEEAIPFRAGETLSWKAMYGQ